MPLSKSIRSSRRAEEIIEKLEEFAGIERSKLARIAICLSARVHGAMAPTDEGMDGYEINTYTLTDNYKDPLLEPLFSLIYQRNFAAMQDADLLTRYVRTHLNEGIYLLDALRQETPGDRYEFFSALERKYVPSLPSTDKQAGLRTVRRLSVCIGKDKQGTEVVWDYNDSNRFPNQHVAIMGMSGYGKTEFLKSLLTKLRTASQQETQAIVFDYKGDLSDDARFIEGMNAQIYNPSEQPLPFNPFILSDYGEKAVSKFAAEMTDTITSAHSLGIVQQRNLREGIIRAFERHRGTPIPHTDFQEVAAVIREQSDKPDTLTEMLDRLSSYDLFAGNDTSQTDYQLLHQRTCVIDLSNLSSYRELVVYIVLDRLYREMKWLGNAHTDGDLREVRCLIAIDEAHHYLKANNPVLSNLIREGRSFGFGVILSSQSITDYEKQETDYSEFINNAFLFRIGKASASQLQRLIRIDRAKADKLLTEALSLSRGECLWNATSDPAQKTEFTYLRTSKLDNE
ncbi:MAG TPA: DUF87 domain-containing protein [Chthonomonadaceae bacterium]|nr:DUF87 domain-containing protein [Chthonomonadaceae bacterium]